MNHELELMKDMTTGRLAPWPRLDARSSYCRSQGCGQIALYDGFCEDCYLELDALRENAAARATARAGGGAGYGQYALCIVQRFEWIGTLAVVAVCFAVFLFEERGFFIDLARSFKSALMWGK